VINLSRLPPETWITTRSRSQEKTVPVSLQKAFRDFFIEVNSKITPAIPVSYPSNHNSLGDHMWTLCKNTGLSGSKKTYYIKSLKLTLENFFEWTMRTNTKLSI
jgi:hypothetical protein